MGESKVKVAGIYLGKLLVDEGKYLWGIEDKVSALRRELIWMQCFLRDADSLTQDEIVAQWVLEGKEYVSEAEDIIDRFVIEVVSRRRQTGWKKRLQRWSCIGWEFYAMHEATVRIESLTKKISTLTPRLQNYGLRTTYGMNRSQETVSDRAQQRMSYAHLDSKKIVGLKKDTEIIVDALLDSKVNRRVVAIYGMGGLGKTTLATNVYMHEKIRKHFSEGFAWAYISKKCQVQNVFRTLLADLTKKSIDEMAGKESKDLICELRECLQGKKCLVVLDDVWEIEVWDLLNDAFRQSLGSGSKVLLTTRKEEVATHADHNALPKPDPLDASSSWVLLQETLGWDLGGETKDREKEGQTEIGTSHTHGSDLTEMFGSNGDEVISLGKEMLKHCNGIPLAIVVLGGILRKKEFDEWRVVKENFSAYLRRGNDRGRSYMEVLALSYNDLPYHLKPFFLHLGIFPEGHAIRTEKLCRMWVAEGLVTQPRDSVTVNESLEDIARGYLADLARAGMVEIVSKGSKGRILSIRMHDLMRDLCLEKAVTENFLSIVDHRPCPDEPYCISSSANHARVLRLAIYLAPEVRNYLPDPLRRKAHEYVRSLLFFAGREVRGGGCEDWTTDIFDKFPFLRVLDMEAICTRGKLANNVQKAIHLRYLSLKETGLSEVPSSISKLRFLETLDLRASYSGSPIKIPNILWKLERLRHLFMPKKPYEVERACLRLDTLCLLETLKHFEVKKGWIEDLQKMKKLKKLSIKDVLCDVRSIKMIVESPALKSGTLRGCSLVVQGSVIDADPRMLSRVNCLSHLRVMGKISALSDDILPQFLEVLDFESCDLDVDPMGMLGCLRHLRELRLGNNSFLGKEMACLDESFPQLVLLELRGLESLENWKMKKGSMPMLKKLTIRDCGNLRSIPDEVPLHVHITCSPCIDGIEKYGTCVCYGGTTFGAFDYQEEPIELPGDTGRQLASLFGGAKEVVLSGMGGVSKNSLANMLQEQDEIKRRFEVIVWGRFPNTRAPNPLRHFILGILRQLAPEMSERHLSEMSTRTIRDELYEVVQKKKCLIVLTDWRSSQIPQEAFGCLLAVEKVLLTTHEELTTHPGKLDVHKLSPLSEDETWALFEKRVGDPLRGKLATVKNEMGKRMLKFCSNQILPIVMLAGMLSMKETLIEWQNTEKKLSSRMSGSEGLEAMYEMMIADLPPSLKRCFLLLSIFPEDMEIATRKLYHLWIAGGFVRLNGGGGDVVELWEDVAEKYLKELVTRGLVHVGKMGTNGRISRCWVEPALRDLCKTMARKEQMGTGADQVQLVEQPSTSTSASNESPLIEHLGVQLTVGDLTVLENVESGTGQLKSLIFFPEVRGESTIETNNNWDWLVKLQTSSCQLLTVLDLEGMWMLKSMLPSEVGNLNELRYLSLKGTRVCELPSTIERLSSLQTLDLRVVEYLVIPDVMFNFQHLRHLHLPDLIAPRTSKLKLRGLNQLRTLGNLDTEKVDLECLPELKNLRKVSVRRIHAAGKAEFDAKLKVIGPRIDLCVNSEIFDGDQTLLSGLQNLNKATIKGEMSIPLSIAMLPLCLKDLTLKHTQLKEDPLPVLEKLPNLRRLCFDHASFIGERMTFSSDAFSRLRNLRLRLLSNTKVDMTRAPGVNDVTLVQDCLETTLISELRELMMSH